MLMIKPPIAPFPKHRNPILYNVCTLITLYYTYIIPIIYLCNNNNNIIITIISLSSSYQQFTRLQKNKNKILIKD